MPSKRQFTITLSARDYDFVHRLAQKTDEKLTTIMADSVMLLKLVVEAPTESLPPIVRHLRDKYGD